MTWPKRRCLGILAIQMMTIKQSYTSSKNNLLIHLHYHRPQMNTNICD
ncbi:unnamed protein product [Anisakis simplex]|uniref:Uncharacterized protein n=1 Tax=Anisakis simplex TaxID=6269 RepID=A0A3P6RFV6_ANISI|nr:unnamed protein product [Anisakis simplex]